MKREYIKKSSNTNKRVDESQMFKFTVSCRTTTVDAKNQAVSVVDDL